MFAAEKLRFGVYAVKGKDTTATGAKLVAMAIDLNPEYCKAQQIATDLGVSLNTVYRWLGHARALGLVPKQSFGKVHHTE